MPINFNEMRLGHDETLFKNDHSRHNNDRFRLAHGVLVIGKIIQKLKDEDEINLTTWDTEIDQTDLALEIYGSYAEVARSSLESGLMLWYDDYVTQKVLEKYGKENS